MAAASAAMSVTIWAAGFTDSISGELSAPARRHISVAQGGVVHDAPPFEWLDGPVVVVVMAGEE